MRKILSAIIVAILFPLPFTVRAQSLDSKQVIYFKTGQAEIPKNEMYKLSALTDSLRNRQPVLIELRGNTDNTGSYTMNLQLSEQRAIAVKDMLVYNGIAENNITVKALGFENPVSNNNTAAGRQLNRRVEIFIQEEKVPGNLVMPQPGISALYAQLATPCQSFCIQNNRDNVIRCDDGTVICIKANSFLDPYSCNGSCITLKVKEVFRKSDMILNNITTTSNNQLLESQGMLFTEAVDCRGNKLKLQKDMVVIVPTDSIKDATKIFDGNRGHDSIMNWTVNNNALLSNFTLPELDRCGNWMCGGVISTINCKTCRFFFCRIGRVGKAAGGIFSRYQRENNAAFRNCQQQLARSKRRSSQVISINPTTVLTRPPLDSIYLPKCQQLEELFKKYGVNDLESLVLAINKPLLDRYKVTTLAELQDTLAKIATKKIEMSYVDKKISFDDYRYYVFNTPSLGWNNVDVFAKIPASQKTTLKVNVVPAQHIDCKLVFVNRRSVMPAETVKDKYEFAGIPKGEEAYIVAVKYEDGQPFLGMRRVTIDKGSFDIEFKALSLDELKQQLKLLDK